MKQTSLILFCAVLLLALFLTPSINASEPAVMCTANPLSAPVGSDIQITCSGFAPNTLTTAWFTQPSGVAQAWPGAKTDSAGVVTYSFPTGYAPYFNVALGQYGWTVKQNDLLGITYFTVTGGTEGVSGGIQIKADPHTFTSGTGTAITARGFSAFETVTVWFDFPNGNCASMTAHGDHLVNSPFAFGGGNVLGGISTMLYTNVKSDEAGNINFVFEPFTVPGLNSFCLGDYHLVARGNSSHLSGDIVVTMIGNVVLENAVLAANPTTVTAMMATVSFTGSGFAPNEIVNCWNTTPQGATIAYDDLSWLLGPLRTDGSGNLQFSIFTGAFSPESLVQSEGALGEWSMSCKGSMSARLGIAHYTVVGSPMDP